MNRIDDLPLEKVAHWSLAFYALTASLSIAVSQIFLLFVILAWLVGLAREGGRLHSGGLPLALPIVTWLGACALATLVGVSWRNGAIELLKTSVYVVEPFAIYSLLRGESLGQCLVRVRFYLLCFLLGQGVASIHTLLSAAAGQDIPPRVPGPVTESGQLVLLLAAVLAIASRPGSRARSWMSGVSALLLIGGMLATGWPGVFGVARGGLAHIAVSALACGAVIAVVWLLGWRLFRSKEHAFLSPLLWLNGAVLLGALVLNLKRGPWLGVLLVLLLFGLFVSRRLVAGTLAAVTLVILFVAPVRERLERYHEDFSVLGGREVMWEIGIELAARYPLGLGPNNAAFMRQLEPSIPPEHRHLHNNLLNIVVETGWIGLAAYLWWMCAAIGLGFLTWIGARGGRDPALRPVGRLALCLSLGLLGWQVAGLVEYNFGDGEIRMIAFVFMGFLLALADLVPQRHGAVQLLRGGLQLRKSRADSTVS